MLVSHIFEAVTPIRAFHGSPYDFAEFDLVKIGSGEGAQTFGHGMYFADAEEVARGYRDRLSPPATWRVPPERVKPEFVDLGYSPAAVDLARETLETYQGNGFQALEHLDTSALYRGSGAARDAAKLIRSLEYSIKVEKGGWMYEVAIYVRPQNLLNWDRLLSEQSAKVQRAVEKILRSSPDGEDIIWRNPGNGDEIDLEHMEPRERAVTERTLRKLNYGKIAPRWQHMLDRLSPRQLALGDDPVQASTTLRNAGIPGIRYLDGFSRDYGKGTYNYVMFDLSKVKVVRKYK